MDANETSYCNSCGQGFLDDDLYTCNECGDELCAMCDDAHECIADWDDEDDEAWDAAEHWPYMPPDRDAQAAKLAIWNAHVAASWNALQKR